jgi:isoamylase
MEGGVNFSIFSKSAASVELFLFDCATDSAPTRTIVFDAGNNRTSDYRHVFVPGLAAGQIYAYQVHGLFDPAQGHRYDSKKLLLLPFIGPGFPDHALHGRRGVVSGNAR